jgi:hypothetical protein
VAHHQLTFAGTGGKATQIAGQIGGLVNSFAG